MCLTDPGFTVDLVVTADTVALHKVWVGQMDWAAALRHRLIVPEGEVALRRAFPGWLTLGFYVGRGRSANAAPALGPQASRPE